VNPANGKRERVFVDLRAIYPTPDEPGTELSFEEVWAANRGWLGQDWEDEELPSFPDENCPPNMDVLARGVSEKLVIHHDVVRLDENGAPIYPKEAKPRKKKVIEVNETQISKPPNSLSVVLRLTPLQSKRSSIRLPGRRSRRRGARPLNRP
jgi:checkpoint serine/threonine-protein kinase